MKFKERCRSYFGTVFLCAVAQVLTQVGTGHSVQYNIC